jgi:hypothetical protein
MTTLSGARMDGIVTEGWRRKQPFVRIQMHTSTKSLAELVRMAQVLDPGARSAMF